MKNFTWISEIVCSSCLCAINLSLLLMYLKDRGTKRSPIHWFLPKFPHWLGLENCIQSWDPETNQVFQKGYQEPNYSTYHWLPPWSALAWSCTQEPNLGTEIWDLTTEPNTHLLNLSFNSILWQTFWSALINTHI